MCDTRKRGFNRRVDFLIGNLKIQVEKGRIKSILVGMLNRLLFVGFCVTLGAAFGASTSGGQADLLRPVRIVVGCLFGLMFGACVLLIRWYFTLLSRAKTVFDYILDLLPVIGLLCGAFITSSYYTQHEYYRDMLDVVPDALCVVMGCISGFIFGLFVSLILRWWRWEWDQATNPNNRHDYFN